MTPQTELMFLLDRLARIHASRRRVAALTDAQIAALVYLAHANRFSRSPSVVAEYLATTRGTASQTLKVLVEKGLIGEPETMGDKRQRRYAVTDKGHALAAELLGWPASAPDAAAILPSARGLVRAMIAGGAATAFGVCHGCRHHESVDGQPVYCRLLKVSLSLEEADQLCHEFDQAA